MKTSLYKFYNMKTFIFLFAFSVFGISAYPQSNIADITNPEILELTEKANDCSDNRLENCNEIYEQAIKLGEKTNEPYVDYLYYLLALHKQINGDNEAAMKIYEEQFPKSKNELVKVAFMNLKANYLSSSGKSDLAIEVYIEIAEILEKLGEKDKLIINYNNIANQFGEIYNFEKHLEYLLKAYAILQEVDDKRMEIFLLSSIAESYKLLKDFDKSKEWAEKAINVAPNPNSLQDKKGLSKGYAILADYYARNNDFEKALYYSEQSVSTLEFLKTDISLGNALFEKSLILYRKQDFKGAKIAMDSAVKMFRELNHNSRLTQSLLFAGLIYEKNGDFKGATALLLEHIRLKDNALLEQNVTVVNELTTKYETEKKERQIAEQELEIQKKSVQMRNWLIAGIVVFGGFLTFLYIMRRNQKNKLKIIEKEKQNEILSARVLGEEVERSRISKELHDGIASNLVAVKLQIENNTEISQKILSLVQETHKEVRQIAHNLMPIDFEKQNLVDVIKSFCEECTTDNRPVNFQTNTEKIILDKDRSMVLYRVVQEFIQNAIKHSQAQQIDVLLMENEGLVTLNIEDNGVGFDTKLKETSKGLSGVIDRLEKIKGKVNIDSSDKGTSVFISIKS